VSSLAKFSQLRKHDKRRRRGELSCRQLRRTVFSEIPLTLW
jgi:hypothetical protein